MLGMGLPSTFSTTTVSTGPPVLTASNTFPQPSTGCQTTLWGPTLRILVCGRLSIILQPHRPSFLHCHLTFVIFQLIPVNLVCLRIFSFLTRQCRKTSSITLSINLWVTLSFVFKSIGSDHVSEVFTATHYGQSKDSMIIQEFLNF